MSRTTWQDPFRKIDAATRFCPWPHKDQGFQGIPGRFRGRDPNSGDATLIPGTRP